MLVCTILLQQAVLTYAPGNVLCRMLLAVTFHTKSLSIVISTKILILLISNVSSVPYEKCVYLLDTPVPVFIFALSKTASKTSCQHLLLAHRLPLKRTVCIPRSLSPPNFGSIVFFAGNPTSFITFTYNYLSIVIPPLPDITIFTSNH
jgi:hypothetical protein